MYAIRKPRAQLLAAPLILASACMVPGPVGDHDAENKGDPIEAAQRECGDDQDCHDRLGVLNCVERRRRALSRFSFLPGYIRWACQDATGVNTKGSDSRGQEYCEYFALVNLPTDEGNETETLGLGRQSSALELTQEQRDALRQNRDAIVGQCVFTSWHSDRDRHTGEPLIPLYGVCDDEGNCPNMKVRVGEGGRAPWMSVDGDVVDMGVPLDGRFQMKGGVNSNGAAIDLVARCMTPQEQVLDSDPDDEEARFRKALDAAKEELFETDTWVESSLSDDYMSACWRTYRLFNTEWRQSDPTVCATAARAGQCSCGVDVNSDGQLLESDGDVTHPWVIAASIVPDAHFATEGRPGTPGRDADGNLVLRGFHLGSWSDPTEPVADCQYIDTGDAHGRTQTLVVCGIKASEVLENTADMKELCRKNYANNVVVHVPLPPKATADHAGLACTSEADACLWEEPWIVRGESLVSSSLDAASAGAE